MNCDMARRFLLLLQHDELDASERRDLEEHLRACEACGAALSEEHRLHAFLAETAPAAPEDLLERCRRDLSAALSRGAVPAAHRADAAPVPSLPFALGVRGFWARVRLSPAFALGLLLAGFLAGWMAMGDGLRVFGRLAGSALGGGEAEAGVTNVSAVAADPKSDRIKVSYDTLKRASLEGSAQDPAIRRLLVATVRDSLNAGLRLDALDALSRQAGDDEVRQTLVRTVREDANPGARLRALDALEGGVRHDPLVRAAVVGALLKDGNPGVRVRAMDILAGARDSETRRVFERLAREDPNDYLRMRSAEMAEDLAPAAVGGHR